MQDKTTSKPATYQDRGQTLRSSSFDGPPKSTTEMQRESKTGQNKNIVELESMYTNLIREGKADHTVYGNLGAIRGIQGRHDELIELTQKALELKPNQYNYLNNLGNAKKAKGDLKDAIGYYRQAIAIKPEFAEAHNNLGTVFRRKASLMRQLCLTKKLSSCEKIMQKHMTTWE